MIFLKNSLKKRNIVNYIVTLLFVIFFLNISLIVKTYLNNTIYEITNTVENRTVTINDNIPCSEFNNIENIKCTNNEIKTFILFNTRDDLNNNLDKFNDEYDISISEFTDSDLQVIIKYINYLLLIIFFVLLLIIFIIAIQFNNDDISIVKILRAIGYTKMKILLKNLSSLLMIITSIFILSFVFIILINIFIIHLVSILEIIQLYLFQYLIIIVLISLVYLISYKLMSNKLK